ncbi:hypothetical protein BDW59DRAFT_157238 [Aspergillus cavernicola]|uniref:Ig-like domain-containing protein n=1 Tax=Aspergillus cavernicola TaxID=176166 RepID=A0ABR4IZW4_9EURO
MAEKPTSRFSFRNTLKSIQTTVKKHVKKHISHKYRRICSSSSSFSSFSSPSPPPPSSFRPMQERSAPMPARKDLDILCHDSSPILSIHKISEPQTPRFLYKPEETESVYTNNENSHEPSHETKSLQIQHLASRLNPLEVFPRSQTIVSLKSKSVFARSRLPTPTGPPKEDLYSHSVYQREGRRNVLSPLGRQCTMRSQDTLNIQNILEKMRRSSTQETISTQSQDRPLSILLRPTVEYREEDDTKRTFAVRKVLAPTPRLVSILVGEEQPGHDGYSSSQCLLLPRCYRARNNVSFFKTNTDEATMNTMASPKSIRSTRAFENLKTQQPQRTKLPMPKQKAKPSPGKLTDQNWKTQSQTQMQEHVKENTPTTYVTHTQQPRGISPPNTRGYANTHRIAKGPVSKIPLVSPGSTRRKVQTDKMVPEPLQIRKARHHTSHFSRIPNRSSTRKNPILTSHLTLPSQVETAMSSGYWLGRFMTLTNAFHYEDSFGEPDISTGFEMPSSYSRPFHISDDGDLAAYRAKRAFMALENLCATEEASESLREFRDGYIKRFGDKWML